MAAEERVVLTVEARDQLTAPLQAMQRSLETTATATAASSARQATGVQRAMQQVQAAQSRTTTSSRTMERGMNQASQSIATGATRAAQETERGFFATMKKGFTKLVTDVKANGDKIISHVNNMASKTKDIGAKIGNSLKDGMANAGKALGIAGGIVGGVVAKAISGGLKRQMNIEDAESKLVGLGSSAAEVSKIMESALEAVSGTAFGMDAAASIAATATASGIAPGKELTKYLTLVADAATIAGTDLGEMGSIMGKVQNSGKVTSIVLKQFGDRGVGALQMLAKHYDVTAGEMSKMVSKGEVDAKTFNMVLEKNLGGAALESGSTTRGAMANMNAALSRIGVSLTMGFFPHLAGGFRQITKALDGMNKEIKPAAEAFGRWFEKYAVPVIDTFGDRAIGAFKEIIGSLRAFKAAFNATEDDITSSGLPGFMEHVGNSARKVKDVVQKMNPHMETLRVTLVPMAGLFLSMSSKALTMIPILGKFLPVLSPLMAIITGLIIASPELRAALGGTFESLVETAGILASAMTPVVLVLSEVVAQAALLVAWLIDKLNPALPVLIPLIVGFYIATQIAAAAITAWKLATMIWTGAQVGYQMALGVNTALTEAQTLATQRGTKGYVAMKLAQYGTVAAMGVATAATVVATVAQRGFNAAMKANPIGLIITAIGLLVTGFILAYNNIGWFKDGVDAAVSWIVDAFHNVVDWWNANLMPAIRAIGDWFGEVFGVIGDIIGNVVGWIKENWGLALSFIIGPLGLAIQWVVEHWGEISEFMGQVWDNIAEFTTSFVDGLMSVLGAIGQWFVDVFGPSVNFIGDVFRNVFEWVERYVWNAITIIVAIFYKLVDLWNGVLKPALDVLAGWFGDILGWIGEKIRGYVGMWVDFFGMIVDWWNDTLYPALETVWDGFMTVLGWIGDGINWYVGLWVGFFGMIIDFWNGVLVPAFEWVAGIIQIVIGWIGEYIMFGVGLWIGFFGMLTDWWNNTLYPALEAVGGWFSTIFNWIYENVIAPVIGFITEKFQGLINWWNSTLQPVIDKVANWFKDKLGGAIDSVTGYIDNVKAGFGLFISFWTDKLKPVVDAITGAFEKMGGIIGGAVSGVKDFASNPLGGVQDWLGIEKDGDGRGVMPTGNSGGGVYPGNGVRFAGGGVLGGYAPGVDSIPAWLSPGESVLVPELTRALGPSNIMAANHAASGGRPAGSGPARATNVQTAPSSGGGGGTSVLVKIEKGAVNLAFEGGDASQLTQEDIEAALEEALRNILDRGY